MLTVLLLANYRKKTLSKSLNFSLPLFPTPTSQNEEIYQAMPWIYFTGQRALRPCESPQWVVFSCRASGCFWQFCTVAAKLQLISSLSSCSALTSYFPLFSPLSRYLWSWPERSDEVVEEEQTCTVAHQLWASSAWPWRSDPIFGLSEVCIFLIRN